MSDQNPRPPTELIPASQEVPSTPQAAVDDPEVYTDALKQLVHQEPPGASGRRAQLLQQLQENDPDWQEYLQRIPVGKRRRIQQHAGRMTTGLAAVAPLTCNGPSKCLFVQHCPIPTVDDQGNLDYGPLVAYPLGRSCVMERVYMQQQVLNYMGWLRVDPDNPVEMALVQDLAIIDLYKSRASMILSAGDRHQQGTDFLRVDVTGFAGDNGHGENTTVELHESTTTTLHPAMDAMEKLEKRRDRIINQFMESRRNRLEIQKQLGAPSQDSKVLDEIRALRDALGKFSTLPSAPVSAGSDPDASSPTVEDAIMLDD